MPVKREGKILNGCPLNELDQWELGAGRVIRALEPNEKKVCN